MRYRSRRPLQEALRLRLRELAATHVRYGYRRLTVLLRREGWAVNAKRVYRLYERRGPEGAQHGAEEDRAPATRFAITCDRAEPELGRRLRSDKLADGRSFRMLTVIDQFARECIGWMADRSMHGSHVVTALTEAIRERGAVPRSITLDNGSEFAGRVLEAWAMQHGVQLCFIRPGRPVENGFIESFNGRLRDECLNVDFSSLNDARETLARRRTHYNQQRPPVAAAPVRRKKRSAAERLRIVEETLVPGASVARVARSHGINASQVFAWRKLHLTGKLGGHRTGATATTTSRLLSVSVSETEPSLIADAPTVRPRFHVPRNHRLHRFTSSFRRHRFEWKATPTSRCFVRCWSACRDDLVSGEHTHLDCSGRHRHAPRLHRTERRRADHTRTRPALGPRFRLPRPSRRSAQDSLVRWRRAMSFCQAAGAWTLRVAEGRERNGLADASAVIDAL